jgi:hypothetical protein
MQRDWKSKAFPEGVLTMRFGQTTYARAASNDVKI